MNKKKIKKTKVVALANLKGGVGKTSLTYNIADLLGQTTSITGEKLKVLVIDMDPQTNLTTMCGIDNTDDMLTLGDIFYYGLDGKESNEIILSVNNMDIIPNDKVLVSKELDLAFLIAAKIVPKGEDGNHEIPDHCPVEVYYYLKEQLQPIIDKNIYDYILIDTPGSLGLYTMSAIIVSDYAVIPICPEDFDIKPLKAVVDFIRKTDCQIAGVIFNKLQPNTKATQNSLYDIMATCEELDLTCFNSYIEMATEVNQAQGNKHNLQDEARLSKKGKTKTIKQTEALVAEFRSRIGGN